MPQIENSRYSIENFEFPPVDFVDGFSKWHHEYCNKIDGYNDMKSYCIASDAWWAAFKFMEQKFTFYNN